MIFEFFKFILLALLSFLHHDQRRYNLRRIALEILNEVLNDASHGDQTFVQQ